MQPDDLLDVLRRTEALLEGHFELRSGLHSDRFFQCAQVLRYPRHAAALGAALAERLESEATRGVALTGVISPALGGIVIGQELGRALAERRRDDRLLAVFAEKTEDRLALRRFTVAPGERYVVAEDVVTRGGRVQETMDLVRGRGAEVCAVAVIVDRSGGQAAFDVPLVSLARLTPVTWSAADCPLCRRSLPLVHPGS